MRNDALTWRWHVLLPRQHICAALLAIGPAAVHHHLSCLAASTYHPAPPHLPALVVYDKHVKMGKLVRLVSRLCGIDGSTASEEDIVRSIKSLQPLGAGYNLIDFGDKRKMVRARLPLSRHRRFLRSHLFKTSTCLSFSHYLRPCSSCMTSMGTPHLGSLPSPPNISACSCAR